MTHPVVEIDPGGCWVAASRRRFLRRRCLHLGLGFLAPQAMRSRCPFVDPVMMELWYYWVGVVGAT